MPATQKQGSTRRILTSRGSQVLFRTDLVQIQQPATRALATENSSAGAAHRKSPRWAHRMSATSDRASSAGETCRAHGDISRRLLHPSTGTGRNSPEAEREMPALVA